MSGSTPKVFISYAHEDGDHPDRVRALADSLRAHGLNVILDQHDPYPTQGWPYWMTDHLLDADYVLMVCTPAYHRRVMRREKAGIGLGAQWEGKLIFNLVYDDAEAGSRFVPILLAGGDPRDIPLPVKTHARYHLETFSLDDRHFDALYRHLTAQPRTPPGEIGAVVPRPPHGGGHNSGPTPVPRAAEPVLHALPTCMVEPPLQETVSPPPATMINPVDGSEMIYIPAGEFIMGTDDGFNEERPQRTVYLDGYYQYLRQQ
jgi:hypothetical protein